MNNSKDSTSVLLRLFEQNPTEFFNSVLKSGNIDVSELESQIIYMRDSRYLERHFGKDFDSKIRKGKDGRYFTRLPNGSQLRKTKREDFIKCIVDYYKELENNPYVNGISVSAVCKEWLKFKSEYENTSQATIDRYEADFNRFFLCNPLADEILNSGINDITENELECFIRGTIKSMQLNPKSWAKFKALIKNIWLYAAKIKATDLYIIKFLDVLNISSRALPRSVKQDSEEVFSDQEVRIIIEYICTHKFSPQNYGILLSFYTGLRIGELAGLKWEDVCSDYHSLKITHMESLCNDAYGKKNLYSVVDHAKTEAGLRTVIVPDAYIPFFMELKRNSDGSPFVFSENGIKLHARSFTDKLYRICSHLGIPKRSMHKARKTVCSKLCDFGVDSRLILKQVGHTDCKTTEAFYHKDRRPLEEKIDIINRAITY